MELNKNYTHQEVERKWYNYWLEQKYFNSTPNQKPAYTIVTPPPNITGVLHLGHTLNMTIQDVLIRHARMQGFNACWIPGCDHASIATETKVIEMLIREKNTTKKEIGRERFLDYCLEWKEKYGNIIYSQFKLLGCSVDWDRVAYTMDKNYEVAVIKIFIELFNKGLIYRGSRMINWDVTAQTALSDEEVEYKEVDSTLHYLKYFIEKNGNPDDEFISIATQRPETIMGDVAICVHPDDERYKKYAGCYVFIPLVNKKIPIIFDAYVDKNFGTGALKITPAHDINDYKIGLNHKLEVIDILDNGGFISDKSTLLVGIERFEARKQIVEKLKQENYILKQENYKTNIGFSQRSNTIVEPKISLQWFVKTETLNKKALNAVLDGKVKIHPEERFLNTYKHWLENPRDWCISRQLWWGQRIPVYYFKDDYVVAENKNEAFEKIKIIHPDITLNDIHQDEDCLDTWFSSWLWPIEVFKGITQPNNVDFNYYYPTNTLVTGQDIIFFWVARMIMAGIEFKNKHPFDFVYFTGMVRDKQGRKMSKSLGNSPDLINLIDQYGADAVRFGVMIASPAGNDLLFDEASLQQGQRFNNKLWNTFKLLQILKSKTATRSLLPNEHFAIAWFENKLNFCKQEIHKQYKQYKLSENLKLIYNLIWDDFCSNFLEWIKPKNDEQIAIETFEKMNYFFEELLQLLHPFMPFITEELHHLINTKNTPLAIKTISIANDVDTLIINQGDKIINILTAIRDYKNKNKLPLNHKIKIEIENKYKTELSNFENILTKIANIETINYTNNINTENESLIIGHTRIFILNDNTKQVENTDNLKKELNYLQGFLSSINKKLLNEKFCANAKPEIIAIEQKKKKDTLEKIKLIENSLNKK